MTKEEANKLKEDIKRLEKMAEREAIKIAVKAPEQTELNSSMRLMTNEECIVFLRNQQNEIKGWIDQVKGYAKEAAQQGIDAYDMAIKALEFVEEVQSMFNANTDDVLKLMLKALKGGSEGWIPCSERLPEVTGEYLVTIKWRNHENTYGYMVGRRDYFAETQTWNDSLVIAWMPLPKPYKEGEADDE